MMKDSRSVEQCYIVAPAGVEEADSSTLHLAGELCVAVRSYLLFTLTTPGFYNISLIGIECIVHILDYSPS